MFLQRAKTLKVIRVLPDFSSRPDHPGVHVFGSQDEDLVQVPGLGQPQPEGDEENRKAFNRSHSCQLTNQSECFPFL